MRLALLVPDGVGVRNFVLGRFLHKLPSTTEARIYHSIPEQVFPQLADGLPAELSWRKLIQYRPSKLIVTLQYSLGYAQMYWADTRAMRLIRNAPIKGSFNVQALHKTAKAGGRLFASPRRMNALEKVHSALVRRLPEVAHYEREYKEFKPSVLFCSHQRPSVVLPAILAARKLNIPTATFIFSWDNLSSKGRIISPFDHYLVWSQHMASELRHYYPHVRAENIHVVGTPQFEPYSDPGLLWTRADFFARIGADPNRPLLCYSGGDPGTCPEDPEHVGVLLQLIRSGRIGRSPQVIVRPAPVDDGRRYQKVRDSYPELIFAQPRWVHAKQGDWSESIPLPEDLQFLANLTHHCDLNVNLGSTMALDFGIHDKPVVNIAFDVADPPIFGMPVWDYYYFFEHYRPVIELGATRAARSADELAHHINAYLENPALDRAGRRRLFEMQVGVPLHLSSQRILDVLQTIAGSNGCAARAAISEATAYPATEAAFAAREPR